MLEKIGDNDVLVKNYTDNFNVKEYFQEELIPKAFPYIPMNRLNAGFHGIVSEYIGQAIEDIEGQSSLMINESFITKAVLPTSIYAEAAVYNLGYRFAVPSICNFAIEIRIDDIIANATPVVNTSIARYILDRSTKVVLGDNTYEFDYDIYIDFTYINGKRVYNVYYNMSEPNSISDITNRYIKHQITSTGWLVLFMDLKEFTRTSDTVSITDNVITTNSEIEISWIKQIAGVDLIYISPQGQRLHMKLKEEFTEPDVEPFVWYRFIDDNKLALSFSSSEGYWMPEFNSKIEYTVYTTIGKAGEFTSYDRKADIPVKKTGERYPYNADTQIVALCYSGSVNAQDRGDIEQLRRDVITRRNTVDVLTTANDLEVWFDNFGKASGNISTFFKRRDDPSGRLFSQFLAIKDGTYVYPTNTLNIRVDFPTDVDQNDFIIQAGHLWEYDDDTELVRNRVRMLQGTDGPAMITDAELPAIPDGKHVFVNPFFIKIHKDPTTSAMYNYLINNTSWPEDIPIDTECFYQFQLGTFSVERTLSTKKSNSYHFELVCVPVITTDTSVTYITKFNDDALLSSNDLRVILVTVSNEHETGYIEMVPTETLDGGAYLFSTDIVIKDALNSDMTLDVDLDNTPRIHTMLDNLSGRILMDSQETSFHFVVLMKDASATSPYQSNPTYNGYATANCFRNANRDLTLYKVMGMMRSTVKFSGDVTTTSIEMSLVPFLKYDIPLDDEKMSYFTQAFQNQYKNMEPVLSKLDGNSYLDIKLYNTYGRSNNYYIGPDDIHPNLKDSELLLDDIYVKVKLIISVYDRSLYTQTVKEITNEITKCFYNLNADDNTDLHVSELIHGIIQNNPNVRYLRFLGFNDYDANKQSIFVKYKNVSDLMRDPNNPDVNPLEIYVPEIIRADENTIDIKEET